MTWWSILIAGAILFFVAWKIYDDYMYKRAKRRGEL